MIALGVLAGAVALFALAAAVWPYLGLRMAMAIITRSVLWLRVRGGVPATGPLLLLSGPVSYLGWLNLLAACPRRVRFLVLAGWGRIGLTGWLLRRAGAIVPDGPTEADLQRALARAPRPCAAARRSACSPRGIGTADGHYWNYSRLFAALPTVPVLPVAMLQPRGSLLGDARRAVHPKLADRRSRRRSR